MLISYYESLAKEGDIAQLLQWALLDERVYNVLEKDEAVLEKVCSMLPNPAAARVLARGTCYQPVSDALMAKHFIPICSKLAGSGSASRGERVIHPLPFRSPISTFGFRGMPALNMANALANA